MICEPAIFVPVPSFVTGNQLNLIAEAQLHENVFIIRIDMTKRNSFGVELWCLKTFKWQRVKQGEVISLESSVGWKKHVELRLDYKSFKRILTLREHSSNALYIS